MAAGLAATAMATGGSISVVFDEDAVNNETNGQLVRVREEVPTVILGGEGDEIIWQVHSQSRYYMDSGEERVRLTHDLKAKIQEGDLIQFELSFRPASVNPPTATTAIGEDFVRCQLSINSSDTRYWQASLIDGWYTCSGNDPTDLCKDATAGFYSDNQEASSSWIVPFSDEYGGTKSPWCITDAKVGDPVKDYACT